MFSTMQLYAVAVLASDIRSDLDISRTQIGIIGAVASGVGAIMSPYVGGLIDRIGAKQGVMTVLGAGGVSMLLTAASPTFAMVLIAAAVGGIPLAGGNVATNKLIGLYVPAGRRGTITGVKQSGVTLSLFLCGLTLPTLAAATTWRWAVAMYGIVALGAAIAVGILLLADPADSEENPSEGAISPPTAPLAPFVYRLSIYGLLMGITTAGILRFLPLFAEEELGMSETVAGLAMAVLGLAGVVSRIVWGRLAEHSVRTRSALTAMALIAVSVAVLLMLAPNVGGWLLWPIAVLTATSSIAWNAVGHLAIIRGVEPAASGRATGMLLLGFLAGLTIGAPMTGAIIDQTGNYTTAWTAVLVTAALAAIVTASGEEPPVREATTPERLTN